MLVGPLFLPLQEDRSVRWDNDVLGGIHSDGRLAKDYKLSQSPQYD